MKNDTQAPTSTLSGLGDRAVAPQALAGNRETAPESAVISYAAEQQTQPQEEWHTVRVQRADLAPRPSLNRALTLPLGSRSPTDSDTTVERDLFPVPTPRVMQLPAALPGRGASADPLSFVSGSRAPGASAAANPAPAPPPVPFRENALRAKTAEPLVETLPEIGDGRWALLGFLGSAVVLALAVAYWGKVEVTSVAAGAVIVEGGPRPVLSQVSGPVADLLIAAGDTVHAGQTLARIDATELEAKKRRSEEQVTFLRAEDARITAQSEKLFAGSTQALRQKSALLSQRANLKRATTKDRKEQAGRFGVLAQEGVLSQSEALTAREQQASIQEDTLVIRQQIADINVELNDRQKTFDEQRQARTREITEAVASAKEATALIELAAVRAPVAGKVESLQVTRGQVVQSGTSLARIIPAGATTSVVVFAPVKDAAFLTSGLTAAVEFASLPVSEFGKVEAEVFRVSVDVASAEEMAMVLGSSPAETLIRVELHLKDGPEFKKVEPRLRSGERVIARLKTRKRRIITLLFDFLRRWYPT